MAEEAVPSADVAIHVAGGRDLSSLGLGFVALLGHRGSLLAHQTATRKSWVRIWHLTSWSLGGSPLGIWEGTYP